MASFIATDALSGAPSPETRDGDTSAASRHTRANVATLLIGIENERAARMLGCLLGGALGDALGYEVERDYLVDIRARFGADGLQEPILYDGLLMVSDDTQMTLFTLEGLARAHALPDPRQPASILAVVREAYLDWYATQQPPESRGSAYGTLALEAAMQVRRRPGRTCESALASGGSGALDAPINDSRGCGGVMRSAPIGLCYSAWPLDAVFDLGVRAAALTHGHPCAYLPAGLMAAMIASLMTGDDLHCAARRAATHVSGHGGKDETLVLFERALDLAAAPSRDAADDIEQLGRGWSGHEALAIGVYSALRARSCREAIVLGANHDGDSDSTAAIAGQLYGTAYGLDGIPDDWIRRLDVIDALVRLVTEVQTRGVGC